MPKADRAAYSPLDFVQWKAANSLSLTPKFQRRGVWKPSIFLLRSFSAGMRISSGTRIGRRTDQEKTGFIGRLH